VTNLQPRDYYESPQLFGDISAHLRTEFSKAPAFEDHEIAAAKLQNAIAYSVNNVLKVEGRSKTKTARNAGMNIKHLYRLLNGETWIRLNDIAGLSHALGVNLINVAEYQGKHPVAWHSSNGQRHERRP
jgi:DNA-binding phage protein